MTVIDDFAAEAVRLQGILGLLTPAQWQAESGAAGWTVADVRPGRLRAAGRRPVRRDRAAGGQDLRVIRHSECMAHFANSLKLWISTSFK